MSGVIIVASFVLVHGAFEGGWCWADVAAKLRAKGHVVHTPTLTGCGDRFHLLTRETSLETHTKDIEQTLIHEDVKDAILVGHSYGGTVITAAAARAPDRVRSLVYFDAQAPEHLHTASGAHGDATNDKLAELTSGDGWLLQPLPLEAVGIMDQKLAARVGPRRHPHPMRTLMEPVHAPPDVLLPMTKSYVICNKRDGLVSLFGADPLAGFVARARREGWRIQEIAAPHDGMLVEPQLTADALLADVR